jgi:release factor glutamine methyltransferase
MFVLGIDRTHLLSYPERVLTSEEQSRFEAAVKRRGDGMPTQYITGHQEFWGLDLIVSPAVLIPRPETEHVVDAVLERARGWAAPRIIDVGTGSGCIALALAKELPDAEIHAIDISPAALEVARANAARHELLDRIRFHESDLLSAYSCEAETFDLVVSNPPYVGELEREILQREVRDFEPEGALFAGAMGLDVIKRLIPQAERVLKVRGWLMMEIGKEQDASVRELLLKWGAIHFIPDLQAIPRVVAARRA